MKEMKLKVEGIECMGCENRIQNALSKIDGVQMIKASHLEGTVTVMSDENLLPKIQETIEDLGFPVIGEG